MKLDIKIIYLMLDYDAEDDCDFSNKCNRLINLPVYQVTMTSVENNVDVETDENYCESQQPTNDDFTLADMVQTYQELYVKDHPKYLCNVHKGLIWNTIAEKSGF
jgi:hypothetical protein